MNISYSKRIINKLVPRVSLIHSIVLKCGIMTSEEIQYKFKRLSLDYKNKEEEENHRLALIAIALSRVLKKIPHDVQLIGSILLQENNIIEMSTGEGKTIVAAMAALLSTPGSGSTHILTVNDYLVKRDYQILKPLYDFFDVKVGYITNESSPQDRKRAYACKVLYATSTEIGFDYLRDSIATKNIDLVLTPFSRVIVDEADSNLLDEANTPLVISNYSEHTSEYFQIYNDIMQRSIVAKDVRVDHKEKVCYLLDTGFKKLEKEAMRMGLIDSEEKLYSQESTHTFYIHCALQAHFIYFKNQQYLIRDGEIVIISDKTGRAMRGRRWSDGIHQAIEAKEGLKVRGDSKTLATITLQNLLRCYPKVAGMTGTAVTDAIEFSKVYNLNTIRIPPNRPCIREKHKDLIFPTAKGKNQAIIEKIKACRSKEQPVLVGTATVAASEQLSDMLKQEGIPHNVLNARWHEQEASIISHAGAPSQVTIATNMAGRGTDIILGGRIVDEDNKKAVEEYQANRKKVIEAGGLFVLASEKHNLRRIDNQLIGRCARQGEPGESQFYISLEDDLIRNFVDTTKIDLTQLTEDEFAPITGILPISSFITNAQKTLESRGLEGRTELMQYDNALHQKRLLYVDLHLQLLKDKFDIDAYMDQVCRELFSLPALKQNRLNIQNLSSIEDYFQLKQAVQSRDTAQEKDIYIFSLVNYWQEFVDYIPNIKLSSSLMSHAQKDPIDVFEAELHSSFEKIMLAYKYNAASSIIALWKTSLEQQDDIVQKS